MRPPKRIIAELTRENAYGRPIVTTLEPAVAYYSAEDYHQDYFLRQQSISAVLRLRSRAEGAKVQSEVRERRKGLVLRHTSETINPARAVSRSLRVMPASSINRSIGGSALAFRPVAMPKKRYMVAIQIQA